MENNRVNMAMIRRMRREEEQLEVDPSPLLLDFWAGFKLMSLVILCVFCILFIGTFFILPPKGVFD